jgi:foldase protein PrsA
MKIQASKKQQNRKWMVTSAVLFVALAGYVSFNPPELDKAEAVAKVNGVEIQKDQLYKAVLASSGEQALNDLIETELIRQEVDKAGVQVLETDIDDALNSVKGSFSSEAEFEQTLMMYGMTMDQLEANVGKQVKLRKLLEPQVAVTDDDIKQYYDQNIDMLKTPEQVEASHILVDTKEEAEAVLAQLKGGADFAQLAKDKSLDEGSKMSGGSLGYFEKGKMEESFENAAFALGDGQLSDIVQTTNGYHIIKVTGHKDAYTPTLEESKAKIQDNLINDKVSELADGWLDNAKSSANIESYLNEI